MVIECLLCLSIYISLKYPSLILILCHVEKHWSRILFVTVFLRTQIVSLFLLQPPLFRVKLSRRRTRKKMTSDVIWFGDSGYDPLALWSLLCFEINICICEVYFYFSKNTDFLKIFNLDFMYINFFLWSFLPFFLLFGGLISGNLKKGKPKQCSECVTGMGSFATRLYLLIFQFLPWKEIWLILNSIRGE